MVQQVAVAASDADLDDATNQLGQRLALSPDSADESEAVPDLLISVLRLQCELLDDELSRRVRYLTEIRNALADLRGLSPREMILAAPVVLSREFGFARTMISTVRRSIWLPQHLHIENEGDDPQSLQLREYLTGAQIHLGTLLGGKSHPQATRTARAVFEARQVYAQGNHRRVRLLGLCRRADHRSGQGNWDAACRPSGTRRNRDDGTSRPVGGLRRMSGRGVRVCGTQREGCPTTRCSRQFMRPRRGMIGQSKEPAWWQLSAGGSGQRHDAYSRGDQRAVPSLTARERQIMSHVAAGATNSEIARCLVISEGTVKSHLKHVARKLNTSSRAAAVAVCAGTATAHAGESR